MGLFFCFSLSLSTESREIMVDRMFWKLGFSLVNNKGDKI